MLDNAAITGSGKVVLDTAPTLNTKNLNAIRFADQFASIKAAYDDGPSTGTWVVVSPGTHVETVQLVLTPQKPLYLTGGGASFGSDATLTLETGITSINWNTAGYFIDTANGTDVMDGVNIENLVISVGSSATGAIRVGRTSTNFADANFRAGWHFSNVTFLGPGATVVGTVGLSLTQIISGQFDNIIVRDFEQPLIWDRCGNSLWNKPRFQSFKFGPLFSLQAGSGTAAAGADLSQIHGGEILGPTTGSGNYNHTIDCNFFATYGMEWELQPGITAAAYQHITANGSNYKDFGSVLSQGSVPTNTFVWDAGYQSPQYFGTILTTPAQPISAGAPNAGVGNNRAEAISCYGYISEAFKALGTAFVCVHGQAQNDGFQVVAATSTFIGPSTGVITVPDATDTLVGKATTDVLTNKTLDTAGAGNVLKVNGTQLTAVTGTGAVALADSPVHTTLVTVTGTSTTTAELLAVTNLSTASNTTKSAVINLRTSDTGSTVKTVAQIVAHPDTNVNSNDGTLSFLTRFGNSAPDEKFRITSTGVVLPFATPTTTGTDVGIGNTTGFGNGVVPTAVTTVLLGTGSGPTTPQTIIGFLKINIGGTDHWIPYMS